VSEHYPKSTESVTRWCGKCARQTQHAVSAGRVGRCMEHAAPAETKAQARRREKAERARRNPTLFDSPAPQREPGEDS
jgi:hypothetical protein